MTHQHHRPNEMADRIAATLWGAAFAAIPLASATAITVSLAVLLGGPAHAATTPPNRPHAQVDASTPLHAASVRASAPVITVTRGDTLSRIAARHCGSASGWPSIHHANRGVIGPNPHRIRVGQRLTITCATVTAQTISRPTETGAWVHPLPGTRLTTCWMQGRTHRGIDLDGYKGQPIYAAHGGVVTVAGWRWSGYGLSLVVDHGDGTWAHYAHLSQVGVSPGQRVTAGQIVAQVGNTGAVIAGPGGDGSHLHLEIATAPGVVGAQVNPAPFLRSRGVSIGC